MIIIYNDIDNTFENNSHIMEGRFWTLKLKIEENPLICF